MKIVINALHARRGGGITYILNLFEGMGNPEGCEFVILESSVEKCLGTFCSAFNAPEIESGYLVLPGRPD